MSNKSPIFPLPQPQHFTDYGFEPQIDYFQVLEEARKHKRESASRSIDLLHFKLQKPISKDDSSKKIKKNKKRWWRNALLFFKFPKWTPPASRDLGGARHRIGSISGPVYITESRSGSPPPSISGPVYITESRSGSSTPYSRAGSGPLVKGEMEIPYMSLRELNMEENRRISGTATPIYLVT
ncbi:uncharacterized protein LOC105171548 isoform X2 [Sesamum indicum]|uniref:Uncharacterized protein LOC105171548 isoform X2 n=1 Tax=Sesamum indicum TaxID=4182 RepID=A0A6I9U334_SESIN|nr:uncharacterized protein LOC105171548 isoform X2 [Sesamum indicum]